MWEVGQNAARNRADKGYCVTHRFQGTIVAKEARLRHGVKAWEG
jgi:hypothetical protein